MKTVTVVACLIAVLALGLGGRPANSEDTQLSELARKALSEFVDGNYGAFCARFDEQMKSALPEAKLQEIWKSITVQFGSFISAGPVRQEKSGVCSVAIGAVSVDALLRHLRSTAGA